MYSYDDVYAATLEYFGGDDLAANVFVTKYALRNKQGELLEKTPDDLHRRIAKEFARIEDKFGGSEALDEETIYEQLKGFKYIVPQGSPLYGIGNTHTLTSLSNCVCVDSPADSMSSIFETGKDLANLYKARCGVGLDLSTLRPEGARVSNAAGTSSGAWSFADFYSYVTRLVGQCIARGERVLTKRGLIEIQNVVPGKDEVWTKIGWVVVDGIRSNGKKKLCKVISKDGFAVRATEEHILLTEINGELIERKVKDFAVGDVVVLIPGTTDSTASYSELDCIPYRYSTYNNSNRLNEDIKIPTVLNESVAYFLGYSYGDGCVEKSRNGDIASMSLACSNDWNPVKDKLVGIILSEFNYKANLTKADGDLERIRFGSRRVVEWLRHNDLLKQKTGDIRVPAKIWSSPKSVQVAFLGGFFDADGFASGKKKGYVFSTLCKEFASSIQLLLMSLGVVSKIHREDRSKFGWNDLYSVCVVGKSAQSRFVDLFADHSVKVCSCGFISKMDHWLTPYMGGFFGISHNSYDYIPDKGHYISAQAFERVVKEASILDAGNLLVRSKVESIIADGEDDTFDLVLPKEHLYFCQGFQVHNSGRRGALMLTMDVKHPDIEKFVTMKHNLSRVTGANISVKLSDEFMSAVQADGDFLLQYPVDSIAPIESRVVKARDLWGLIVDSATKTAEPGILFWDNILKRLPAECYGDVGFKTVCVNPCAELSLSGFDSCRLISINLKHLVKNPFTDDAQFDFRHFGKIVAKAMRLSDDLVELELEKLSKIIAKTDTLEEKEMWTKLYTACKNGRRTGLGTHGLADAIARLGVKYDSDEALELVKKLYATLRNEAYRESAALSKERGSFPVFDWAKEEHNEFIQDLPASIIELIKTGRRNISLLTNAPTGSISILSQTSSGIEPVFRNSYTRRKKINHNESTTADFVDVTGDKWQEFEVFHHNAKEWLDSNPGKKLPDFFSQSDDVSWQKRVELQALAQVSIDHSISSTINLPKETSAETVGQIYLEAWKKGLKGVTVYVDGCRSGVLVTNETKSECGGLAYHDAPKRPDKMPCNIHHISVKGEKWTIVVGMMECKDGSSRPFEVFGGVSNFIEIPKKFTSGQIEKIIKRGDSTRYDLHFGDDGLVKDITKVFENKEYGVLTRMLSLSLRHGSRPSYVCEQLLKDPDSDLNSFSRVISRVLKKYIEDGTKVGSDKLCGSCGQESLLYVSGCVQCSACGWSKCQ
jgi:ribonucleoside-diphosphate reductase alpha chain